MENGQQMEDEDGLKELGMLSHKREGKGRDLSAVFTFLVGRQR